MIICVLQCDDLADQVAVETERRACQGSPLQSSRQAVVYLTSFLVSLFL